MYRMRRKKSLTFCRKCMFFCALRLHEFENLMHTNKHTQNRAAHTWNSNVWCVEPCNVVAWRNVAWCWRHSVTSSPYLYPCTYVPHVLRYFFLTFSFKPSHNPPASTFPSNSSHKKSFSKPSRIQFRVYNINTSYFSLRSLKERSLF